MPRSETSQSIFQELSQYSASCQGSKTRGCNLRNLLSRSPEIHTQSASSPSQSLVECVALSTEVAAGGESSVVGRLRVRGVGGAEGLRSRKASSLRRVGWLGVALAICSFVHSSHVYLS